MTAFYDFFRFIKLYSTDGTTLEHTIEADAVTDTLSISRGAGVAWTGASAATDSFKIDVNYNLEVPVGTTTLRLTDVHSVDQDIELHAGGNMTITRNHSGSITLASLMGGVSRVITSATQASPVVITTNTVHDFTEGTPVTIVDVVGMTQLNGNEYYADVLTSNTLALYEDDVLSVPLDGTGFTAYTSGGVATGEYAGAKKINDLTDVKFNAPNFADSIMLGYTTTGTLNNAHSNIFIGKDAGKTVTSGNQNTVIGHKAGDSITDGTNNVLIGAFAGDSIQGGDGNIIIGDYSPSGWINNTTAIYTGDGKRRLYIGNSNPNVDGTVLDGQYYSSSWHHYTQGGAFRAQAEGAGSLPSPITNPPYATTYLERAYITIDATNNPVTNQPARIHVGGGHLALHGGDGFVVGSTMTEYTPTGQWGASGTRTPGTYTGVTVATGVSGNHPTFTVVVAVSDGSITSVTSETTGSEIYDLTSANTISDSQIGNGGAPDIQFKYEGATTTQAKLTMIGDTTLAVTPAGATINSKDVMLDGAVTSHLIPDTDIAYDLGSATHKFRDLYLDGSSIHLGSTILRDDGAGSLQVNLTNVLQIAADDSTIRTINSGESIKFVGTGSVTTATDEEGNLTIWGAGSLNDLTDVIANVTDFPDSILIGHTTTGVLNGAARNTFIGLPGNSTSLGTFAAGQTITSGDDNTGIGAGALSKITTGSHNTAVGHSAFGGPYSQTDFITHSYSTAVGGYAGWRSKSGNYNTLVGYSAGKEMETGSSNTAVGAISMQGMESGSHNTAVGYFALDNPEQGEDNVVIGARALLGGTATSPGPLRNIVIGRDAGFIITTATDNVLIGYTAGDAIATGSNNVIIGDYAGTATLADTVAIYAGSTERLTIDSTGGTLNGDTLATQNYVNTQITASSTSDLTGSVFGDDSTVLVDGVNSAINLDGTMKTHMIPALDATYDIGSAEKKIRDLYVDGGGSFWIGDTTKMQIAPYKFQDASFGHFVELTGVADEPDDSYSPRLYGIVISPDGTKLYTPQADRTSPLPDYMRIVQFTLSTPFDLSTITNTVAPANSLDVSGQVNALGSGGVFANTDTSIGGIHFKPDGTKLWMMTGASTSYSGGTGPTYHSANKLVEYDLSSAWDITSATFNNKWSEALYGYSASQFKISEDGRFLYMRSTRTIKQWEMTTPFDISTLTQYEDFNLEQTYLKSYLTVREHSSGSYDNLTDMWISKDGWRWFGLFNHGLSNDSIIYGYTMTTKYDITTSVPIGLVNEHITQQDPPYQNSIMIAGSNHPNGNNGQQTGMSDEWGDWTRSIFFADDGKKLYVAGYYDNYPTEGAGGIQQYNITDSIAPQLKFKGLGKGVKIEGEIELASGASVSEVSTDGTMADNSDTAVPTEKAVKTYVDAGVNPTGAVLSFAGESAPTGWLLCYGQAISRTTYAGLFTVLAEVYGAGDGSTTFNVPDLRGRTIAGQDDMGGASADRLTGAGGVGGIDGDVLGASGGTEAVTLTEAQMPAHTHDYTDPPSTGTAQNFAGISVTGGAGTSQTGITGSGSAHVNMQPTLILNYIIKT